MKRDVLISLAALSLLALIVSPGAAQQPQPPAKPALAESAGMTVQPAGRFLYLVKGGSGAHTAFYITQKQVIAVDAKMTTDAGRQMVAEIAKFTPNPLSILIITHSDLDHVNGLAGFPPGLTILASEGTKKEMEEAFQDEKLAALRAYLPTQTYTGQMDLRALMPDGKMALISLYHFGPAHTSGDTVILFHNEKTAFVGDLAFSGRDPLIHRQKGGTSIGYIATLKKIIDLPADTYLSGHADPLTKEDLSKLLASMEEKLAKVKDLIGQGKSLDEVKAAMGVQTAAGSRWPSLVEVMYLDLTEKR
jgi:cyclase